jgi:hypothetical protein
MITMLPHATEKLGVPRAVYIGTDIGAPMGKPGDGAAHAKALLLCLRRAATISRGEVSKDHRTAAVAL